jgi:tartrate-resistant acid phosphatase type 5
MRRSTPVLWLLLGMVTGCRCEGGAAETAAARATQAVAQKAAVAPAAPEHTALTADAPCKPLELATGPGSVTRIGVIGDYGFRGPPEEAVARWVLSQNPDVVITTGDNNYPNGEAETIDANIGQFYGSLICPYRGRYGPGSEVNRFFPALGNHDWITRQAKPYLDYFTLPHNERYYDVVLGNVHLFVVDSDEQEPDGITADSVQARWFKARVKASSAPFKVFTFHHPPFSTGSHGSTPEMRWPFHEWGVDVVLTGHDHHYERSEHEGVIHVVNGLGGRSIYPIQERKQNENVAFNSQFGAQLLEVTPTQLRSRFYTVQGDLVDEFEVNK